ncbi:MAG: M24 family metallopeptidase [Spirochaetaceae bacterium]|nr:M24 family metallopeptidase [Spirochaetaceae bacterium]
MVARTLEEMRASGMDVLVGASPATLADLAGYRNWIDPLFREYMMRPGGSSATEQALAVLSAEGEVTLLVSAEMAANASGTGADRIVVWGSAEGAPRDLPAGFEKVAEAFGRPRHATRTEALLALLDGAGAAARIGAEREALAAATWEALAGGGRRAGDCTNLLRLGRMVKSEPQIAMLQRAAEAAEYAAAEALALACVGSSWRELTDLYRMKLAEHGADLDHFSGSPTGFGLATEAEYRLPERGSMYFDHGCRLRSWFSDTGHTIAFGPPDDACRQRQAAVRDAVAAGAEQLAPGKPASAAAEAMRQALDAAGLSGFPHGHGIGLEVRDYPIVVPDTGLRIADDFVSRPADLPLEAGMVLNLESAVWAADVSSVHCERSFVIAGGGCRPLADQPRDEPLSISSGA